MIRNDFDIQEFLLNRGFEQTDSRTYIHESPSIKIKLFAPDMSYRCGYNMMAITSPKRLFKKREFDVPVDTERAGLVVNQFLRHKAKMDPDFNEVFETQGTINEIIPIKKGDELLGYDVALVINGTDYEVLFKARQVDVVKEVSRAGVYDVAHVIFKITGSRSGTRIFNYLNIIGFILIETK